MQCIHFAVIFVFSIIDVACLRILGCSFKPQSRYCKAALQSKQIYYN